MKSEERAVHHNYPFVEKWSLFSPHGYTGHTYTIIHFNFQIPQENPFWQHIPQSFRATGVILGSDREGHCLSPQPSFLSTTCPCHPSCRPWENKLSTLKSRTRIWMFTKHSGTKLTYSCVFSSLLVLTALSAIETHSLGSGTPLCYCACSCNLWLERKMSSVGLRENI